MAVFMLDDVDGSVEVVVFPETFGKHGTLIDDRRHAARARASSNATTSRARLVATELLPIAALMERTTREVAIHLTAPQHGRHAFEALAELLSRHRGDRRVSLELDVRGANRPLRVRAEVAQRVQPSERLVADVEQLCGDRIGGAEMSAQAQLSAARHWTGDPADSCEL